MPGPFPGMDPYLEDPAVWQGVHNTFITYLWAALNAALPPQYAAQVEERYYVVHPDRQIIPDLTVRRWQPVTSTPPAEGSVAVAPAIAIDPPLVLKTLPFEVKETYINIVTLKERSRIVTTIEILSPTNKALGTEGWRLYKQKQEEVLASQTHLIEIDLLRQGEHTVAAPKAPLLREGHWDYIVSLHRG